MCFGNICSSLSTLCLLDLRDIGTLLYFFFMSVTKVLVREELWINVPVAMFFFSCRGCGHSFLPF